jgi:hypothetical protein
MGNQMQHELSRVAALRAGCSAVVEFCRGLTAEQWSSRSRCPGGTVQDVVAQMGAALSRHSRPVGGQGPMTFDHRVHLRDDLATALDRPVTLSDPGRPLVLLE